MTKTRQILHLIFGFILILVWITGCSRVTQDPDSSLSDSGMETKPTTDSLTSEQDNQLNLKKEMQVPEIAEGLEGLPLNDFFEQSFQRIMLRDPEWVTAEGLDEILGAPGDQLTDISDDYLRESHTLYQAVLDLLLTYDRDALTTEQQISYDVYRWYLDDLIRQFEFLHYDYPITHFVTGVQYDLIYFFTDLHPIETKTDAENYITRLSLIDDKFDGLIEVLELREETGVIAPRFIWQWSMSSVMDIANTSAQFTPFYESFAGKIISISGATDAEKQDLLEDAETTISESVIPAFKELAETMQHMASIAPTDDGVWQFENGIDYYAYTLRHHTTADMTPEEVHELGLKELDRVHSEMYAAFKKLEYPTNGVSLAALYDRLEEEGGVISGDQIAVTFENLVAEAENNLDAAFDIRPKAPFTVIAGDWGDFYVSASLDGKRPGVFYAQTGSGSQNYIGMPTLAYHEGVPGHHFQISIAKESDLPLFRNAIDFTGYVEGWALYAERLASDLGWYADDPYGDLGRLQAEAFRAARLVIDTGIHTQGWTFDQAQTFLEENVGLNPGDNINARFEISRYISWPGQATAYMVGMRKILDLRWYAADELGEHFDLREFHNVVLSNGSMPLDVLQRVVEQYVEDKLEEISTAAERLKYDLSRAEGVIVFSSYREGESEIFAINPNGTNLTRLTDNPNRNSRPAWTKDGTKIAYVSRMGTTSNYEIFSMNPDGSGNARINRNSDSFESEPVWSPDGTHVAFISNRPVSENTFDSRFNIFMMDINGENQVLLTNIDGSSSSPDWSPDGSKIAFQTTVDGNYEIYTIGLDGKNLVNLTNHPASDHSPSWSPDGSKIAFVSDRNGVNEEIYVMDADGSNVIRLTHKPGYDKGPSWSPDGQFIVYYGAWGLNAELYVMRADGSINLQLTYDGNFDGFPDWQPNPSVLNAAESGIPPVVGVENTTSLPPTDALVDNLEDLDLNEFFDASFELILRRDPEGITSLGLADFFGLRNDQLTDISPAYIQQNYEIYAEILALLKTYDREILTANEQVSYDVYAWYLNDLVRQGEFMLYEYPLSHFFVTSVPYQTLDLFTELHPITDIQDVEDYIARLSQIDKKFDRLIEGLKLRSRAGIVVPQFSLRQALASVAEIANSPAEFTPFYRTLREKMGPISGIDLDLQEEYLKIAKTEIEFSVIPAYQKLAEYLTEIEKDAPTEIGVSQYENGEEYYAYVLHHFTTTDLTPDEVHELGYLELARVQAEMREIFNALGYPKDESLTQSFNRVASESGSLRGNQILARYDEILNEAEAGLDIAFDIQPRAKLVVIGGPSGGYYISPALDGSRPGAFYAATTGTESIYKMATLAYHEGLPGHHFQIALAGEADLPLFRNVVSFLGYVEGWALYAENLAEELGWYRDDPYGNLGRLQFEAWRAARLVVDTGIHTKGWSYSQAADFLVENTGLNAGHMNYEVGRYAVWPGQATSYLVGMLKILELRQKAMDELGDQFDLKEFHNVVLSNGAMPLEILEQVVEDYIQEKSGM